MFAQVIQGRVTDATGLRRQWEKWERDIKPGARGYLGSTGGVTPDGEFIIVARFENEEAARANSERPEQTTWWEETSKYVSDPLFHDCTEVDLINDGGSDEAGFVQVIQGKTKDVAKSRELDSRMEPQLRELRPDVIGGLVAWHPENGRYTNTIYFKSEAEARAKEREMESAEGFQEFMKEMEALSDGEPKFLDLSEPWMSSG
jgi:hypothetical protein